MDYRILCYDYFVMILLQCYENKGGRLLWNLMDFVYYEKKEIHLGRCIEITAELSGLKKEDEIKDIKKQKKLNNDDIEKICANCPNYLD